MDAETDAFFDSLMNEAPAETTAVPKAAAFDPPPREVRRSRHKGVGLVDLSGTSSTFKLQDDDSI